MGGAVEESGRGSDTKIWAHIFHSSVIFVALSQLYCKLPVKFKLGEMTSRVAAWLLNISFKMAAIDAEFWASLKTNFSGKRAL